MELFRKSSSLFVRMLCTQFPSTPSPEYLTLLLFLFYFYVIILLLFFTKQKKSLIKRSTSIKTKSMLQLFQYLNLTLASMLKLVARLYLGYSVIRFKSSTLFTRICNILSMHCLFFLPFFILISIK